MGEASGENRAIDAAQSAISSPLLELSMDGAKGVLFIVTGGPDMSMHEVNEAAKIITGSADSDAKIIFGAIVNEELENTIKLTVIATGFDTKVYKEKMREKQITVEEKNSYKPSQFLTEEKEKDEEKPEEDDDTKTKKDDYKIPAQETKDKEEEDLDIPAFIRKKMM